MLKHHITFSTSATQYCQSDVEGVDVLAPALLPVPTVTSTPRMTSKLVLAADSPLNQSFMSTSTWAFEDNEKDSDFEPDSSFHSESEDDDQQW